MKYQLGFLIHKTPFFFFGSVVVPTTINRRILFLIWRKLWKRALDIESALTIKISFSIPTIICCFFVTITLRTSVKHAVTARATVSHHLCSYSRKSMCYLKQSPALIGMVLLGSAITWWIYSWQPIQSNHFLHGPVEGTFWLYLLEYCYTSGWVCRQCEKWLRRVALHN